MVSYNTLIIVLGLIIDIAFIVRDGKHKDAFSIVLKTLASLMFVILAIVNCQNDVSKFVIYALVFDCLGDFILILRNVDSKHKNAIYVAGTLVFMIAHFLLSYYLYRIDNSCFINGTLFGFLFVAITGTYLLSVLEASKGFKVMGLIYIFVIAQTFGLSLFAHVTMKTTASLMFMIGSMLFTLSDLILMFHKYGRKKIEILQPIYRILYYVSQILIAICIGL